MIAILSHSELDMEVSDVSIETIESNDCRRMSRSGRGVNGVLAMMQEGARFSCKDGWKFSDPFT